MTRASDSRSVGRRNLETVRPLRLLVISSYLPGVGGGELQTALQVRTLVQKGHSVDVIDIGNNPGAPAFEILDGARVHRVRQIKAPILGGILARRGLRMLLRSLGGQVDLIHFNHIGLALVPVMKLAHRRRVPLLLVVWGSSRPGVGPFASGWRQRVALAAARRADRFVALGSETIRNLADAGFPADRVTLIPNGLDLAALGAGAPPLPPQDRPEGRPVVISVGRLVSAKGYDVLIASWSKVRQTFPQAKLVLVGDGPEKPALMAKAERLGITDGLVFAGVRRNVPSWLASADLYVSSSLTEGMSNALLEAIGTGLPVVATRVGGAEDVIEEGRTGTLVSRGSSEALAAAIMSMLADEGRLRTMGRAAREKAEAELSIETVVQRYEQVYKDMLA